MLIRSHKGLSLVAFSILAICAGPAAAQSVIHVPGNYPNIQSAINAASNGDTIMVADGTYSGRDNRNLRLWGKAITVRSVHGPAVTTIECSSASRGFEIVDGEGRDTVIEGFTIQNCLATGTQQGAGIYIVNSSPVIRNCVIKSSLSENQGGGLYSFAPSDLDPVLVEGCTFLYNQSYGDGGGLWAWNAEVVGTDFLINQAGQSFTGVAADGGGAYLGNAEVYGCRFTDNHARRGGGLAMHGSTTVKNALFEYNAADIFGVTTNQGGAIMTDGASCRLDFVTMQGNEALLPAPPGDTEGDSLFLQGWDADVFASIL